MNEWLYTLSGEWKLFLVLSLFATILAFIVWRCPGCIANNTTLKGFISNKILAGFGGTLIGAIAAVTAIHKFLNRIASRESIPERITLINLVRDEINSNMWSIVGALCVCFAVFIVKGASERHSIRWEAVMIGVNFLVMMFIGLTSYDIYGAYLNILPLLPD